MCSLQPEHCTGPGRSEGSRGTCTHPRPLPPGPVEGELGCWPLRGVPVGRDAVGALMERDRDLMTPWALRPHTP